MGFFGEMISLMLTGKTLEEHGVEPRPKKERKGFSDEEILALGLYPDDECYKMSLISKIINKD